MPYPRQLLQIDFDQFHRYAAVTVLLKPLIIAASPTLQRPIRILEVGPHSLNLLPSFLAPLPVEIVRADLDEDLHDGTGPYVQLTREAPFPFPDEAFDFTVALEVLEHIPGEERMFAVSEWTRVARQAVILSCPNGTRVRHAEKRADRAYRQRHGNEPHPWLEEHERYGQPVPREVRVLLGQLGLCCHSFANSPLAEWLPLLMVTEEALEQGSRELIKLINEMLNLRPFRAFIQEPAYRRIYVGFKSQEKAKHARQAWYLDKAFQDAHSNRSRFSVDPVRMLSRRFTQLLKELQTSAGHVGQVTDLQQELAEVRIDLERSKSQQLHYRWMFETFSSRRSRWLRSWCSLRNRFGLSNAGLSTPHETHNLVAEGSNRWHTAGHDPHFIWSTRYPPGWYRIIVHGQVLAGEQAKLYLDYGQGFSEDTAHLIGVWPVGSARFVSYIYFHHLVQRLRFDPADKPTPVQLDRLSIDRRTAWQVACSGLSSFIKRLWCAPRETYEHLVTAIRKKKFGHHLLQLACGPNANVIFTSNRYKTWLFRQRPSLRERKELALHLRNQAPALSLAIVLSLSKESTQQEVRTTLQSLLHQDSSAWELWCITTKEDQRRFLDSAEEAKLQSKLNWLITEPNTPLSRAYHQCSEQLQATHFLPLHAGDELEPDTVLQLLDKARQNPQAVLIYSDEDHLDKDQAYVHPLLKPDVAPESFFHQPSLLSHTAAVNCQKLRELGGFHPTFEGALLPEFFYLVLQHDETVAHVRRVLVHHPLSRPLKHGQRLVQERLMEEYRRKGEAHLRKTNPLVSILIPSAGRMTTIHGKEEMHLARCLSSIKLKSTYPNYEIIVVDNGNLSHEAETVMTHFGANRISVPGPFNYSRNINEAAKNSRGNVLLLLNDDTEVLSQDWLEKLLFFACQDKIGAVGAKLLFPTGHLQHVGIALAPAGPGHPYYGLPQETNGYLNCCFEPRNWLAVTGACLMTSRQAFEAVTGLDETFELNYNDVDYCLRLWQAGYRCVCDPRVELYHYETMRADGRAQFRPGELARFNARWKEKYPYDPYFIMEP